MNTFYYKIEGSLGYLTRLVNKAISHVLKDRFGSAGINLSAEQWVVLVLLWNRDGREQNDLAHNLVLDKSTVSRLINSLARKGLVVRRSVRGDNRVKHVFLTKKGHEIRDECVSIARALLKDAQEGIPYKDLALCRDVLLRVYENLVS